MFVNNTLPKEHNIYINGKLKKTEINRDSQQKTCYVGVAATPLKASKDARDSIARSELNPIIE